MCKPQVIATLMASMNIIAATNHFCLQIQFQQDTIGLQSAIKADVWNAACTDCQSFIIIPYGMTPIVIILRLLITIKCSHYQYCSKVSIYSIPKDILQIFCAARIEMNNCGIINNLLQLWNNANTVHYLFYYGIY